MNPVAMQPIGAGQTMTKGENVAPGANADAENPAEPPDAGYSYCLTPKADGTWDASKEKAEADDAAEGEDASAAPAPAEGGDNEAEEGEESLVKGASFLDAVKAIHADNETQKSGGAAQEQGNMDAGFKGQGGGQVHG